MQEFETEEQQIEAIKKFWKENGMAIVIGAVLGLGGLWGWRYYNESQLNAQEQASVAYTQTLEQLAGEAADVGAAKSYIDANSDSGYALLTALQVAKTAVERSDYNEAAKQLQWVADNSGEEGLRSLALVRLARIQTQQQDYAAALTSLEAVKGEGYAAQVSELQGDVFQAQGNIDKARAAYSAALEQNANNNLLQIKLDNLASAAVAHEG